MTSNQQAMEIVRNLRDTMPHTPEGDRGAVILGSIWLHLSGQHRFTGLSMIQPQLNGACGNAVSSLSGPDCEAGHAPTRLTDDCGALTLPYALIGLAAYMVYWMISHGIFHALTALQTGR